MEQYRVQLWWVGVVEMMTAVAKRRYSAGWRLVAFVDIAV
jgi:hypothetical protein